MTLRVLALLAGVALLAGGCHKDDPKTADPLDNPSKSCGLLSDASLTSLTGGTKVKASGEIGSAETRANGGMKCQVYDAATGKPLLVISVNDVPEGSTNAAIQAMVLKERTSIPGCTARANLPDSGYLCAQADQTMAAAATPKRLIRVLATGAARTRLTADNAAKLIDEANTSVDKYDAAHS